ncbi:hypothetical protein [Chlamydia buteonis]
MSIPLRYSGGTCLSIGVRSVARCSLSSGVAVVIGIAIDQCV